MTREWDWKFGNSLVPLPNSRWRKILLINKNWAPLPDHHVKSLFNVRQIEEEVWNVILLLLVIPNFTHFIPFFLLLLSPASLEYSSNNFTVHTLLRPSKRQCFEFYTGKGTKLKVFFCSRCHVEFSINFSLLVAMIKKCRMNRNCSPWITLSLFSFVVFAQNFYNYTNICDKLISVIRVIYRGEFFMFFSPLSGDGKTFFLALLEIFTPENQKLGWKYRIHSPIASTSPVQFNFLLGESFRDEDGGGKFRYFSVLLAPVKHKFDIREKCCLSQVASAAASVGVMTK